MLKRNHFVLKLCLGTTGSILNSQDEMAQNWLKMAVFDPVFGHREPRMPCFGTPSREKLPFDMGINMQKHWSIFETTRRKENISEGLGIHRSLFFCNQLLDMEAM